MFRGLRWDGIEEHLCGLVGASKGFYVGVKLCFGACMFVGQSREINADRNVVLIRKYLNKLSRV